MSGEGGIPIAAAAPKVEESKTSMILQSQDVAKFLQILGDKATGRGVPVAAETPAMRQGLTPLNPRYFGLQQKQPIPYQRIVGNGQNLNQVLRGFAASKQLGGVEPNDAALVMANAMKTSNLITTAFDNRTTTSIYAGVPKSASQNLLEINKRRRREDSIYAFN